MKEGGDESIVLTTIEVTKKVRDRLRELRIHTHETYNDVIERVLAEEDHISESTRLEIEAALREVEERGTVPHAQVKRGYGL